MSRAAIAVVRSLFPVYASGTLLLCALTLRPGSSLGVVACLSVLHCFGYELLLHLRRPSWLRAAFFAVTIVVLGSIGIMGALESPEYLRSVFHAGAAIYCLFLYRRDTISRALQSKVNARTIYLFSLIMVASGFAWVLIYGTLGLLLLHGTAPLWMLFNFYTVGILVVGLHATLSIRRNLSIRVRIGNALFEVDGRDCTPLLGRTDRVLLLTFLSDPQRRATCAGIASAMASGVDARHGSDDDCARCIQENRKATLCHAYRRIYNQVLKVKKILETLEVGTIVPPTNKMRVTHDGWAFRAFADVTLHIVVDRRQ
jgi:hypothetical protein